MMLVTLLHNLTDMIGRAAYSRFAKIVLLHPFQEVSVAVVVTV